MSKFLDLEGVNQLVINLRNEISGSGGSGGGLEDLGYFANDDELITHVIMNDLPSGLYTITFGYFAIPTLLALFKVSTAKYHASLFNGNSMTEVYVDYPNSIVEVFAYKTEINSIQSQLVGLADLLEGI